MPMILGVRLDHLSLDTFRERVSSSLQGNKSLIIFTPNAEMLVDANRDDVFREQLNQSDVALPDSISVVWASSVLGEEKVQRITGVDALQEIIEITAEKNKGIVLLGGNSNSAELSASRFRQEFKNLDIEGIDPGLVSVDNDDWSEPKDLIQKINHLKPTVLAVAFGHKKQEKWILDHIDQLPSVRVVMGVGGALDYLSGNIKRAPKCMRKLGLEWLFRLIKQPSRIGRIIKATIIFPFLVISAKLRSKSP